MGESYVEGLRKMVEEVFSEGKDLNATSTQIEQILNKKYS